MNLKQRLYNLCLAFINNRQAVVLNKIRETEQSLLQETKSTAGDKHETGRAMLQLEREKLGFQLKEIEKEKLHLTKINLEGEHKICSHGSIINTSQDNYFIAISAGELKAEGISYYAISPQTPIGKLLLGKGLGDEIVFREQMFVITSIS